MTSMNNAARQLAKKRWAGKSAEERRATMAIARAARDLSPEARTAIGRRLAAARAAKRAEAQNS